MSEDGDKIKLPVAESPAFLAAFRLGVPVILGGILTVALSINSEQRDQGRQLSQLQGQLGVISQQNSDYVLRLQKVEQELDEFGKHQSELTGRVLVLESEKPK